MNNNTGVTGDSLANATHRGFDDTVGDQTFFGGDNLVSQPNKVSIIYCLCLQYAISLELLVLWQFKHQSYRSKYLFSNHNLPNHYYQSFD